jgi:UDP-glucose 4-epimerase
VNEADDGQAKARRVAITGATGFVGANLARTLLREGGDVHLIVRAQHDVWRLSDLSSEFAWHVIDLGQRNQVRDALREIQPHVVFHLAAYGAYPSQQDLDLAIATNYVGTINLVMAAVDAGVTRVVCAGSSSEYGFKSGPPEEQEYVDPNSYYAATKAGATQMCRYISLREQIPITTLRLYSVYGPFEEPSRLIPTLVARALQGSLPRLAAPSTSRDFVYVSDVVRAFCMAAEDPERLLGEVYNIGSEVQTSLADLVSLVRGMFEIEDEPRWGDYARRSWDTSVWVSNSTKAQAQLGWSAAVSLEEGLRNTANWLTARQDLKERYGLHLG